MIQRGQLATNLIFYIYCEARLLFNLSFFEVPLSCFESNKQGANKMEFPARPLDKLEPLRASLKAFFSSIA